MPPKPKSGKKTTPADRGNPPTSQETCFLCCRAIVDGKEDALRCEGEQSCNRWMHHYCAGVSVEHYKALDQSPLPINCSFCVQNKQASLINDLKNAVAVLTAEVAELRAALAAQQQQPGQANPSDNDGICKWTDVVARRPGRRQPRERPPTGPLQTRRPQHSGKSQGAAVNSPHQEGASQRVQVPRVRRGYKKGSMLLLPWFFRP